MNNWDPPPWDPPVVDTTGTQTPTAPPEPRLPPATTHHFPAVVVPRDPPRLPSYSPRVPVQPRPRRRVPVWILVGGAAVGFAAAVAIAGPDTEPTTAQLPPAGATVIAATTTAGTTVPPPDTTVAVQPLLPQSSCHPSYSPCVPIDDDVDCAGGTGDGPSYVEGPITVTGDDEYGLDDDGDGTGCE